MTPIKPDANPLWQTHPWLCFRCRVLLRSKEIKTNYRIFSFPDKHILLVGTKIGIVISVHLSGMRAVAACPLCRHLYMQCGSISCLFIRLYGVHIARNWGGHLSIVSCQQSPSGSWSVVIAQWNEVAVCAVVWRWLYDAHPGILIAHDAFGCIPVVCHVLQVYAELAGWRVHQRGAHVANRALETHYLSHKHHQRQNVNANVTNDRERDIELATWLSTSCMHVCIMWGLPRIETERRRALPASIRNGNGIDIEIGQANQGHC